MLSGVFGGLSRVKGTIKSDSEGEVSGAAIAVIVIAIVIIAFLAVTFWPKGEVSTFHATVSVTIHNDAYFDRVPYTLYIDDSSVKADSVGPLDTVSLSFPVEWTGTHSTHSFALKIVTGSGTQNFSVTIKDGGIGSVPITI